MQAISYALCLLCVYRVSMYTTNIWLIWGKFREESGSEAATSVKKFRSPSPGQGLRCCQPGKAAFLCSVVYNSYIIEEFHQSTRWINPPYLQLGKFEYARHEYHYVFATQCSQIFQTERWAICASIVMFATEEAAVRIFHGEEMFHTYILWLFMPQSSDQ